MMGWYHYGMGWGGWLVISLVMVTLWALVIWALVAIFRGTREPGSAPEAPRSDPMAILDERFARGEIDAEEYHARQGILRAATR